MGQYFGRCVLSLLLLLSLVNGIWGFPAEKSHRYFRAGPAESSGFSENDEQKFFPASSGNEKNLKGNGTLEPVHFFEVTRPVNVPAGSEACSVVLLEHSFAYSYGLPPAEATFSPPAKCGTKWENVVLKWRGFCKGRQFDRISVVWLNGVELLRTCTAEPVAQGMVWEVEKDVTRFSTLFRQTGKVVLSLANIVDETYTGIFDITVEAVFYKSSKQSPELRLSEAEVDGADAGLSGPADIVVPVTLMPKVVSDGGYIMRIENSSHTVSVTLDNIPRNVYRAVLEVCVSYHENDEFWYSNPPNIWSEMNNMSSRGNGPYREVVVALDGWTVGAVWPFPVVYTGGLNPYLWQPTAAIGAFNLPSYDVEITPFVGRMVDGNSHTFSFSVTNALNVWFVQGNLHLWRDSQVVHTRGQLLTYHAPPYTQKLQTHGYKGGLDGKFATSAARRISYSGLVNSSHGNIITQASSRLKFRNNMVFSHEAAFQRIDQDTTMDSVVSAETDLRHLLHRHHVLSFPFHLNYLENALPDKSVTISLNLTHAYVQHDEEQFTIPPPSSLFSSLHNSQTVSGLLIIFPNKSNTGSAQSNQEYTYNSTAACFKRTVITANRAVISDVTVSTPECNETSFSLSPAFL